MRGKTIHGYTITEFLGEGGMAEVWYAENRAGRASAIKFMLPKFIPHAEAKKRFEAEARVMVKLNHPNIRQILDYGEFEQRPFIIMEYLEGKDLSKVNMLLVENTLIDNWWKQCLFALQHVHEMGIIHRDIKPSNIFLEKSGNIKLLDFGIAKIKDEYSLTQTGQTLGSVWYMSPEQIINPKAVTSATDIYSLGVSFAHLILGKPIYENTESDFSVQLQITQGKICLDGLSDDWMKKISSATKLEPEKRKASKDLLNDSNKNIDDEVKQIRKLYICSKAGKEHAFLENNSQGICQLCPPNYFSFLTTIIDTSLLWTDDIEEKWQELKHENNLKYIDLQQNQTEETRIFESNSTILKDFEKLNNYRKINFSELYYLLFAKNSNLLIVWQDDENIFYSENKVDDSQNVITLAINPFLGFKKSLDIKQFFLSSNWRLSRVFSIEAAIALSCRDLANDKDYFFNFQYFNASRNMFFNVNDGIIEMLGFFHDEDHHPSYYFSENNKEEWLGFAFKGLQNQYLILTGVIKDRLLLDYSGFIIQIDHKTLVEYDRTIPTKVTENIFIQAEDNTSQKQLHISVDGNNDFVANIDISPYKRSISYEDAIKKSSEFFVCNAEGQLLSDKRLTYSERSEHKEFYQFKELGNSYIPKDWLRLVDHNGEIIESCNYLFFLDLIITLDLNHKIVIEINRKEVIKID